MNKNKILIIALLALVLMMIAPVSAETLTGELGTTGISTVTWNMTGTGGGFIYQHIYFKGIEYATAPTALIRWSIAIKDTFDAGAPSGEATPVIFRLSNGTINASYQATDRNGAIVGTGFLGYSRVFNSAVPPVEQPGGYTWISFTTLNLTGLSGNQYLFMDYNRSALHNMTSGEHTTIAYMAPDNGKFGFGSSYTGNPAVAGSYLINKVEDVFARYSATKPSGLGVAGSVIKTGSNGITYNSRIFISDLNHKTITSDVTFNSVTFNFSVFEPQIYISVLSPQATWFNSSLLFWPGYGTPTPTPTPTQPIGPDYPIPAGYIRSMVQCVDGQTAGAIHGANIQIKDVENLSWSNATARFDGTWWIDTLPGHTIDAYADATGYTSVSRLALPASGSIMYELIMWASDIPAAPAGKVTLYIVINDADSGNAITGAGITVRDSTGVTQAQTTGTSGTRMFEVANNSLVYITASKYGYLSQARTITTSVSGTDTVRVELMRAVVTTAPTNTIPAGGVTTAISVDPRTNIEKGDSAIKILYDNGEAIVMVCVVVTILSLLGIKLGK